MATRCVLWDFGDTLVDQDWMLKAPDAFPNWRQAWIDVARGDLEDTWMLGEVACEDISRQVATRLGMSESDVMSHIRHCCRSIRFFDAVLRAAKSCPLPQAIVTVNPDVFTNYVVPHYRLDELFPVIMASWQEGTVDKTALCMRVLESFQDSLEREETLLIDNSPANIHAWEESGGQGYLFVGEKQLVADLESRKVFNR